MKSLELVQRKSLIDPKFRLSQDLGDITPAFYRSGPTQTRSCTDILCFLIFTLVTGCLLIIMILALTYGNPKLIYVGYDVADNACGVGNYVDYPYLYFYNTTEQEDGSWDTICVSSCPTEGDTTLSCGVNSIITSCSDSSITIYGTYEYMGFLCLPYNSTLFDEIGPALSGITSVAQIFVELWNNWQFELASMGFAYVLGLISVFSITFVPKTMIVFFIISVFLGLLFFGIIWAINYSDPDLLYSVLVTEKNSGVVYSMLYSTSDEFKLIASILFFISAFVFLLCMIVFNKKIRLLMIMMKSTALFIRARKSFAFLSFIFFLVLTGYLFIWVMILLYLWTWEDNASENTYTTPFQHFTTSSIGIIFLIIHAVSFFWSLAFIFTSYTFILNASCVFWYFSHGDWEEYNRKLPNPLGIALKLYFRYHLGSIAQGAFLLLLFRSFNATFGYCYNKITNYGRETQDKCSQFTIRTCMCFLFCYEKIFRFVIRDAFIEMTLTGKNFLNSAKEAFYLVKRNKEKYEMVEGLGHLVFWLGKLFICLVTSVVALIFCLFCEYFSQKIDNPLIPLLVIMILSFLLGNVIMNLLATITDTLIFIYLVDEEIERVHYDALEPHSAPEQLREFMRETVKEIFPEI